MGKGVAKDFSDDEAKKSAAQVIDERLAGPAGWGSRGEKGRKQKDAGQERSEERRCQSQQRFLAGDAPPTPEPEDDFSDMLDDEYEGGFIPDGEGTESHGYNNANGAQSNAATTSPLLPTMSVSTQKGGKNENLNDSTCRECGDDTISMQYRETFGIQVCKGCCAADKKYKLITKSAAKEELLVTDEDLKPLSFITRKNPRKDGWGDMKLFLRVQVEDIAFERYGDLVGVEAAKLKRQDDKYERLKRKKVTSSVLKKDNNEERTPESAYAADGSRGLGSSMTILESLGRYKKKKTTKTQAPPPRAIPAGRHVHVWGEEWYDEAKAIWRHKCTECSCTASFEKL